MQSITAIGFVGKNPETKFTPDGSKCIEFSFCVSVYKKKESVPVWYTVSIWDEMHDKILSHVKKGTQLIIEGDLEVPHSYLYKNEPRVSLRIKPYKIRFAPFKKKEENGPSILEEFEKETKRQKFEMSEGELPF